MQEAALAQRSLIHACAPTVADLVDGEGLGLLQLPFIIDSLFLQEEADVVRAVQEVCVCPENLQGAGLHDQQALDWVMQQVLPCWGIENLTGHLPVHACVFVEKTDSFSRLKPSTSSFARCLSPVTSSGVAKPSMTR